MNGYTLNYILITTHYKTQSTGRQNLIVFESRLNSCVYWKKTDIRILPTVSNSHTPKKYV